MAKLLGRQTSAMAERCSHLAPGRLRDEVAALERSLAVTGSGGKVVNINQ